MNSCRYSSAAHFDLTEIVSYLFDLNPVAADHFVNVLEGTCALLAQHPFIGRSRPELGKDLRSFPIGNYLIFYIPAAHGIDVIRVVHGSRDLPKQFHQD